MKLTRRLSAAETKTLFDATRATLIEWTDRLRAETGDGFPEKVTAFREAMAVHGRYGEPCPVCGSPVQRIRYADNETNYCPTCQTEGRLLADRALSRLLKEDFRAVARGLEEINSGEPSAAFAPAPPPKPPQRTPIFPPSCRLRLRNARPAHLEALPRPAQRRRMRVAAAESRRVRRRRSPWRVSGTPISGANIRACTSDVGRSVSKANTITMFVT